MTNSGGIIIKTWKSGSPNLKWEITFPHVEGFMKKKLFILKNEAIFLTWEKTLVDLVQTKAGLSLLRADPNKEAKRAHQEALLEKQQKWAEAA
ncbi:hypothetical protein VP01_28g7 [Puccinia sorghi]|uniref:Uncharacterized protein n=1 Tax=Puccinia sorghi TaxID=27349 RepID=A0A0L6V1H4_9BASI|nr:hypothetical protein VP01_28g7 [Puccinia sorghi]